MYCKEVRVNEKTDSNIDQKYITVFLYKIGF